MPIREVWLAPWPVGALNALPARAEGRRIWLSGLFGGRKHPREFFDHFTQDRKVRAWKRRQVVLAGCEIVLVAVMDAGRVSVTAVITEDIPTGRALKHPRVVVVRNPAHFDLSSANPNVEQLGDIDFDATATGHDTLTRICARLTAALDWQKPRAVLNDERVSGQNFSVD